MMNPDELELLRYALRMQSSVPIVRDESAYIQYLMPHYSDDRFKHAQTVYLAQGYQLHRDYVKGASYEYSDRLSQWDWDKSQAAWDKVKTMDLPHWSAKSREEYLKLYFADDGLKLVHILAGCNWSNGYAYQVYGFIRSEQE